MADEKLILPIQTKLDVTDVSRNVKKIESEFRAFSGKTNEGFTRISASAKITGNALVNLGNNAKWMAAQSVEANKTLTTMTNTFNQLRGAVVLAMGAIAAMGARGMTDMIKAATSFNELRSYFKGTEKDLENFTKATKRTVAQADIIRMSNQLSDLDVTMEQQTVLFSLAKDAGDAYGVSLEAGMSKVLMATNGSERALAKLGISVVTYKNNLDELIKASGKKIEMMTVEEQETVKLEALMKSANRTFDEAISGTQSQNDKLQAMAVAYDEVKLSIGQLLAAQLEATGVIEILNPAMDDITENLKDQNTWTYKLASTTWERAIPAVGALYTSYKMLKAGYDYLFGESNEEYMARYEHELQIMNEERKQREKTMHMLAEEEAVKKRIASENENIKASSSGQTNNYSAYLKEGTRGYVVPRATLPGIRPGEYKEPGDLAINVKTPYELDRQANEDNEIKKLRLKQENDRKQEELERQKWDAIQSIAQQGTDVIGDLFYNAFMGQHVNIERAFRQMLAKMAADFISSGLLTMIMQLFNPASAGLGLFGAVGKIFGFAGGVESLRGQGTETSDSIPAMLSRNESVLNAGATRAIQATMGAGWITELNKLYARGRSNYSAGTFAGGIESIPQRISQSSTVGDIYIRFDGGVTQKLDYELRRTGTPKNDRRINK